VATTLAFEYVTSAVSLLRSDGIVVHVVNDSGAAENAHVVIYQNTGAGASPVADSGSVEIAPTWTWGFAFTVSQSGEYWVRIQATSEFLIPKASFERLQNSVWSPLVSYRPSDFAILTLQPHRRRLLPSSGQCLPRISDLRALAPGVVLCLTVLGYRAPGDGGGGDFYWDASATEADNGGTIIVPASGPGRWKRLINGPWSVEWFGAVRDGTSNDAPTINAALTACPSGGIVELANGDYALSETLTISKPLTFRGAHVRYTNLIWRGGAKSSHRGSG